MTAPVVEQIAQEIVERLENITIANGYSLNIKDVLRPKRDGNWIDNEGERHAIENYTATLTQGTPIKDVENSIMGNPPRVAWIQPFAIGLFVIDEDSTTQPVEQLINYIHADAVKAITVPQASWHTFGGLALNAEFGEPEPMLNSDGKSDGIVLRLDVTYRTPENDPYTAVP